MFSNGNERITSRFDKHKSIHTNRHIKRIGLLQPRLHGNYSECELSICLFLKCAHTIHMIRKELFFSCWNFPNLIRCFIKTYRIWFDARKCGIFHPVYFFTHWAWRRWRHLHVQVQVTMNRSWLNTFSKRNTTQNKKKIQQHGKKSTTKLNFDGTRGRAKTIFGVSCHTGAIHQWNWVINEPTKYERTEKRPHAQCVQNTISVCMWMGTLIWQW